MATTSRPQFSLLASWVFASVICLELALMVSDSHTLSILAFLAVLPTVFGGIGYLLGRTTGLVIGVFVAAELVCLSLPFGAVFLWPS